jgi:hypothetical protein
MERVMVVPGVAAGGSQAERGTSVEVRRGNLSLLRKKYFARVFGEREKRP